ncbi:MAG: DUF547 domain-containing protein [Acidobacteria bacterium]|nr:DUF547 domain-containing protein [Acidobacteriota bacterium]
MRRYSNLIKGVSFLLILAALILLSRALPVDSGVQALQGWIKSLGIWGPFIFGVIYAVAATLFLPASALTLAGGAIFGLAVGTLTVWLAATATVVLSFLIARYIAREKVARLAAGNPKFGAIDKAIGEGGWKIVAMLRLSPAIPFNLQNYLYGVTAIRFWPCVGASSLFMLPGTFLYVYLGHLGGQGLAAATGGGGGKTAGQWALLVVGLLATVGVTVYVTRLANAAIKKQTAIAAAEPETTEAAPQQELPQGTPWGTIATAGVAILIFSAAVYAYQSRESLKGLFGPPRVTLEEAYEPRPGGTKFDHATLDTLLWNHVDDDGWVDYNSLQADAPDLDAYIELVAGAPFDEMGRDEKLALLINAYNAFTLRLILDHYPVESIYDIPEDQRWEAARWSIGGKIWSLSQIEHEQIRPKFVEPRIHFALVCAAVSCPKLRNEAYQADRLDEQLEDQTEYVHAGERWFRFDKEAGIVELTQLYDWYGGDFVQVGGSVVGYAARYSSQLDAALKAGREPRIHWLAYDWSLNIDPAAATS